MAENTFTLKLLIDTGKVKRVLFAEANKDFVDFLFHILSLPVAAVIRLLQGQEMPGSLPILFQSLENLSNDYIQPNKSKDTFLKPAVPVSGTSLLPAVTYAATGNKLDKKFYMCQNHHNPGFYHNGAYYISDDASAVCPTCNKTMTKALSYVDPPGSGIKGPGGSSDNVGLVKGAVTYMVLDDLVVKPMSTISAIALLNELSVKELGALEEKVVNFGKDEAVKLLKACIGSKNVLSHLFC